MLPFIYECCPCGRNCRYDPPEAETESCGHRQPYLFHEECTETLESSDYDNGQHQQHDQKFPTAFQNHRTQDLVVCGRRSSRDHPATDELSDPGEDKVGDIAYIDTVECGQTGSLRVYGKKQLAPAQTSEPESERPGSHGKKYELPAARPYAGHESGPLHITEGEPEQDGGYGG